jgi:hypothetical protein
MCEFKAFDWVSEPGRLVKFMGAIRCASGITPFGKVLEHARTENARLKVGALVFVGDVMEEPADALVAKATGLGVPTFMFQEADDPGAEVVFKSVAAASGGACRPCSRL